MKTLQLSILENARKIWSKNYILRLRSMHLRKWGTACKSLCQVKWYGATRQENLE